MSVGLVEASTALSSECARSTKQPRTEYDRTQSFNRSTTDTVRHPLRWRHVVVGILKFFAADNWLHLQK